MDTAERGTTRTVLFVCVHNASRSQMAEALFNQLAPAGLEAHSAGTDPADHIHPLAIQAMEEIEGFPIRIRGFDSAGAIDDESALKSITPEELSDDLFALPAGYEVVNLADQIGKGR